MLGSFYKILQGPLSVLDDVFFKDRKQPQESTEDLEGLN